MKIKSKDFRIPAGKKVDLKKWPTRVKPIYKSKKNYHKLMETQVTALSALQRLHYASNRYAVLPRSHHETQARTAIDPQDAGEITLG